MPKIMHVLLSLKYLSRTLDVFLKFGKNCLCVQAICVATQSRRCISSVRGIKYSFLPLYLCPVYPAQQQTTWVWPPARRGRLGSVSRERKNRHGASQGSCSAFASAWKELSLNVRHASQPFLLNITSNHPFCSPACPEFTGRSTLPRHLCIYLITWIFDVKRVGWFGCSDTSVSCKNNIIVTVPFYLM